MSAPLPAPIPSTKHPGKRALRALSIFQFCKAVLLIGIGLGAFQLVDPTFVRRAERWVATFGTGWIDRETAQLALAKLTGLSDRRLQTLGAGAFLFATLFTIEGIGLWLERRWAELLTVIATSSLIPLEIYELTNRVTLGRVSALILNIALALYLSSLLWRKRYRKS